MRGLLIPRIPAHGYRHGPKRRPTLAERSGAMHQSEGPAARAAPDRGFVHGEMRARYWESAAWAVS